MRRPGPARVLRAPSHLFYNTPNHAEYERTTIPMRRTIKTLVPHRWHMTSRVLEHSIQHSVLQTLQVVDASLWGWFAHFAIPNAGKYSPKNLCAYQACRYLAPAPVIR
jgi:hypothetical protein